MKLEEGYNQKVWSVLKKIKKYCTLKNADYPIQYEIYLLPIKNNILSSQEECEILKDLSESGAIKIYNRQIKGDFRILVYLDEIQPKFNEIYREFEISQQNYFVQKNEKSQRIENNVPDSHNNYNLFFPKYYLSQEINRLEIILKHFLKAGAISYQDYKYLVIILKMLRKLISESVGKDKRNKFNRKDYFKNNLIYKKNKKFRKQNFKKPIITKKENAEQIIPLEKQPVPITGEIVVSGLNEGLKALSKKEPEKSEPKFPYKIPAGTHWNNVIIKFLDNENVEIHVKRLKHKTDYKEMGMIGKGKVPEPSEQWLFMKVLAQYQGEITIRDPEAKDKYKKQKQALTETLRNYFSIDYDPFYPYHSCLEKGGNSYKIKLLLIPHLEKNIRPNIIEEEADPLGIQEFLSDTFRQVNNY
jgi:hypothetical protein